MDGNTMARNGIDLTIETPTDGDATRDDAGWLVRHYVEINWTENTLAVRHLHRDDMDELTRKALTGHIFTFDVAPLPAADYERLLDEQLARAQRLRDAMVDAHATGNIPGPRATRALEALHDIIDSLNDGAHPGFSNRGTPSVVAWPLPITTESLSRLAGTR